MTSLHWGHHRIYTSIDGLTEIASRYDPRATKLLTHCARNKYYLIWNSVAYIHLYLPGTGAETQRDTHTVNCMGIPPAQLSPDIYISRRVLSTSICIILHFLLSLIQ